MNYYLDTEFIEGFKKPLFGKRRHFIDLISIGIVAEDGKTYYAISNEFNPKDASPWVRQNVLVPLVNEIIKNYKRKEFIEKLEGEEYVHDLNGSIRLIQQQIGKSNKKIAYEIQAFTSGHTTWELNYVTSSTAQQKITEGINKNKPVFYAYYADYDWVLFCSLFGTMMDLPEGYPMYCRDLQQMKDEIMQEYKQPYSNGIGVVYPSSVPNECGIIGHYNSIEEITGYPEQKNEHNALADATWNRDLHLFLQKLKPTLAKTTTDEEISSTYGINSLGVSSLGSTGKAPNRASTQLPVDPSAGKFSDNRGKE